MKILHLIHKPQNRGAETFACQLAAHQEKLGHQISMVAIYPGTAELAWKGKMFCIEGSEQKKILDLKAWKNLYKLIKELDPDIIQANSGDTLKYAIFSKKVFGWKTPVVFRNASEVGRYLNSVYQRKLNGYLYKQVSGIASVSRASKLDIISHFPFLKSKTRVIPVGLEPYTNLEGVSLQPTGKKHILHVGGFSFEKNHEGLLRIFNEVLELKPDIHLHLIGDGPLRSKIENLAIDLGIEQQITFYGFVTNPLDYIESSDLLVLPSKIEGLPGVLLEAMYCRTPVIAYNVGGINEIVNKATGSLIEKDNETEFAKAIIRSLEQSNNSQITEAHRMVTRKFMNEKLAKKFLEFYDKVIN